MHTTFSMKFCTLSNAGQLMEIAKEIYDSDLKVRIIDSLNDSAGGTAGPIELSTKSSLKSVVVKFRLDFDNTEYVMHSHVLAEPRQIY
jgi:guanylate cyclase